MADNYDVSSLSPANVKIVRKYEKRVLKEVYSNAQNKDFEFARDGLQYFYFKVVLRGGPYEGQVHIIEQKLVYGSDAEVYIYPKSAPKCKFLTSIWHANVSEEGSVCLDVLQDAWSMTMFTVAVVKAIELLVASPNISNPNNKVAAKMMGDDKLAFEEKVASYYNYERAPPAIRALFM